MVDASLILEKPTNLISKVGLENAAVLLHTDNARLAGEDLENKYNMELCLRQNIETDVVALRRGLEILTVERGDLEFQLARLTEDQEEMTKNHTEEVNILKAQLGARVNVEMDVSPSVDLKGTLDSIRNEYENLMEKNIKEMETWFTKQSEDLNYEMVTESEQLQSAKNELIELRHTAQNLEIDLQTQMNMKSALEGTLAETEKTYCSELAEIQEMVNKIEADLAQLRVDMECQNIEYKVLMDVKSRLEYEISTYRRLLEGEEKQLTETFPETFPKRPRQGLKVVSITEELEDGRVISKYEKVHHLPYKHQPK
ncbi:keratin, type I cytoskeletal 17-like [Hyperolius riggenbachi]|uniref:keratin, type I cytoskeletal 17-like n=1 Tax=Hyperolius riggenbachi TaxID=752182 RepID=UPI0035A3CBDF